MRGILLRNCRGRITSWQRYATDILPSCVPSSLLSDPVLSYHVLCSQQVQDAVLLLLPSLDEMPEGVEGLRIFLLLNELLHWIQRHGTRGTSTTLTEAVAAAAQRLSAESLQVLGTTRARCSTVAYASFNINHRIM